MSDWTGLYRDSWNGTICPESFAHPAKFAPALIRHIYDHAVSEGWLKPGDSVVDPFGGVALGALHAMRHGLTWCGCELEPRFVALAEQNIALWNRKYGRLPRWGSARIVQGDSRRLAEVIGATVGATISSPPFSEAGSQPTSQHQDVNVSKLAGKNIYRHKWSREGIGNLPARAGDFDLALSSPPYADSEGSPSLGSVNKDDWGNDGRDICGRRGLTAQYGSTPGQLGAMRPGDVAGCVSSPPYEGSDVSGTYAQGTCRMNPNSKHYRPSAVKNAEKFATPRPYGQSPGQLGQESGDTFWSASRTILEQVHAILRPGGHAIWVVKAFVKGGKIVDFPGQWQALCESVGFRTLHVHRAWLVEDHGVQGALVGDEKRHRTERKSFFRRLAEKKGSPRIDYEVVLCTEKA